MKSLLNVELANKVCLTRVDFNCPLDDQKKILDTTRIKAHAKTIKYISDHRGKPVVIAHQGRPSSADFSSLKEHSEKLQKILGPKYEVEFIAQTHGPEVEVLIKAMNEGEILVLENVRKLKSEMVNKIAEEHATDSYIRSLVSIGDIFVNDAFSAAHRSHMSMVGFPPELPSYAGLIMEREITNLQRVVDSPGKPCVFVMGGIKPEDSFKVAEHVLSQNIADYVLTGGGLSLILLKAQDYPLGDKNEAFLRHTGLLKFVNIARQLIKVFPKRIKAQSDLACLDDGRRIFALDDLPLPFRILDIGDKTIEEYTTLIESATTVVFNGPMGKFEEKGFENGTLAILRAMERSKGFSLAGGGHSASVIEKYVIKNLSYVSTSGGAMIRFLMGKELPAITALHTYS